MASNVTDPKKMTIKFRIVEKATMTFKQWYENKKSRYSSEADALKQWEAMCVGTGGKVDINADSREFEDYEEWLDEIEEDNKVEGEEEEEKEPEFIYDTVKDMKVNELTGTYYQTYGGGPEGGYYKTNERWYRLHRTWHQPWTVTLCQDMQVLYDNGTFIRPLAIFPAGPPEPLVEGEDYEVMPPA